MPKLSIPDTFMARGKGDVITSAEVSALIGCDPAHRRYSLRACAAADAMMKLKRKKGEPCTIIQVKDDLRILTDAEAASYNRRISDTKVRGLRQSHRRNCEVQVERLTERQRAEHDRDLGVTGARVAATSAAVIRGMTTLRPQARTTPGARSYRTKD
jgi:hypothetical protein